MQKLTIIGMGPGDVSYLTLEALEAFKASSVVYTRTLKHPTVDALIERGINFVGFDDTYDNAETFDEVYLEIVRQIDALLKEKDIVYAVPGNPFVAEKTVDLLYQKYPEARIIYGVSFLDAIITRLGLDPVDGMSVVNALDLPKMLTQSADALICIQCYNKVVASELRIWLNKSYSDEKEVILMRAAGNQSLEHVQKMKLYELDRYDHFDHLTSIVVMPDINHTRYDFTSLVATINTLRSENGCPWDREQTHDTIKNNLLEESYEVLEAINQDDIYGIEEELGDVLLQVVFHSQMATENGDFSIEDVVDGITSKMIYRHPHVFGSLEVDDADNVIENWETSKNIDRGHQTVSDVLGKYSHGLPAAFRAQKVANKAIKSGFKFDTDMQQLEKIQEEVDELKAALISGSQDGIYEELGDVLYAALSFAARFKLPAENIIHDATDKFIKRFRIMEKNIINLGKTLDKTPVEDLISAWEEAKKAN